MKRAALLVLLLLWAAPAAASGQDLANEISRAIMSPFCEGVTLHDCPSRQADELRERIAMWADAGWDRDRIMDRLVDEFGGQIRAAPAPYEGSGFPAYALPALVLLTGVVLVPWLASRWARRRDEDRARVAGVPPSEQEKRRLAEELASYRSTR